MYMPIRVVRAQQFISGGTPSPRSAQSPRITVDHLEQTICEIRSKCLHMSDDMRGDIPRTLQKTCASASGGGRRAQTLSRSAHSAAIARPGSRVVVERVDGERRAARPSCSLPSTRSGSGQRRSRPSVPPSPRRSPSLPSSWFVAPRAVPSRKVARRRSRSLGNLYPHPRPLFKLPTCYQHFQPALQQCPPSGPMAHLPPIQHSCTRTASVPGARNRS